MTGPISAAVAAELIVCIAIVAAAYFITEGGHSVLALIAGVAP